MIKLSAISVFLFFITINSFCQQFEKPAEGKTLVYFVRFQGALAVMDFKYFDGQKYLGKGSGDNYYIYECEPGEHIFWVAAENREYIKGNLKPDCTYVIEVRPYMRAVMAGVRLIQISPTDNRALKKISELINKIQAAEWKGQEEDFNTFIEDGMARYGDIENKVAELNPDWTF